MEEVMKEENISIPFDLDYYDKRLQISEESREALATYKPVSVEYSVTWIKI